MALRLDQFAKGLARHVHVPEQFAADVAPALQPTFEQRDIGVAQLLQRARGGLGQAFTVVVHHDGGAPARNAAPCIEFEPAGGKVGRKQRVGLSERVFLAHVDQGDFLADQQGLAHVVESLEVKGLGHEVFKKVNESAGG